MYKEATKLKLRFTTERGILSLEQLWDLSLSTLDDLAVLLEKAYKESGKKSFLVKKSKKDKELKLKFDIVLDILTTKVEESEASKNSLEIKEYNEKILALIAEKQEESLKDKSISDLKALLKK